MYGASFGVLAFLWIVSILEIDTIQGFHIEPTRVKRGIFGTVTSTVFKTVEERVYVPASCLYLEPNLPNCRNVRFLFPNRDAFGLWTGNELNPSSTTTEKNDGKSIQASRREDVDQTKTVYIKGWGDYLGFNQETVTTTAIKIETTTVKDPRIVVTYAVKGCKPNNIPTNIERCPEDESLELAEILPTSTVLSRIEATRIPEKIGSGAAVSLESAEIYKEQELLENTRATKSL